MNKIRFVYFDVGGVLNDWSRAFKTATKKFNIPFKEFLNLWKEVDDDITRGRITAQDLWGKAIIRFNLKNADNFDLLTSWIGDYRPRKEVHDLIYQLVGKYKIGIISNIYTGMMPILLKEKIAPNIDYSAVVLSCDVGLKKPEKEIYEIATEKSGVKPDEILFIDDRLDFIEGAKSCGWQTFLFETNNINQSINRLKKILK